MTPKAGIVGAFVLALVTLALFGPFVWATVGGDQSVYAYIGQVTLQGGAPYQDAWDVKPPGVFLAYASALAVGGGSDVALQAFDFAVVLLGACVLLFGLGSVLGPAAGIGAGSAYVAVMQALVAQGYFGQPELAAGAAVCGLSTLLAHEAKCPSAAFLGAVLVSFATVFKTPYVLFGLGLVPILAGLGKERRGLAGFALAATGLAVPALAVVAFFASRGALGDLSTALIEAPRLVAEARSETGVSLGQSVTTTAGAVAGWIPLVLLAAVVGLVAPPRGKPGVLAAGMGLCGIGIVAAVAQSAFLPYHWLASAPGLAVLAGVGLERVREGLALKPGPAMALGVVSAVAMPGLSYLGILEYWQKLAAGQWSREAYLDQVPSPYSLGSDWVSVGRMKRFAEAARSKASTGDRMLAFEMHPAMNFYAGMRSPSRFLYHKPLNDSVSQRRGWGTEFEGAVTARPPEWIMLSVGSRDSALAADGLAAMRDWPALFESEYRLEAEDGPLRLYRHVGGGQ
jgi:hypothetical protein